MDHQLLQHPQQNVAFTQSAQLSGRQCLGSLEALAHDHRADLSAEQAWLESIGNECRLSKRRTPETVCE